MLPLVVLLLIIALAGGVFVHPLLFAIAILAVFAFFGPRYGGRRW